MNRRIFSIAAILCLTLSNAAWSRYTHPSSIPGTPVGQYANTSPLPGSGIAINQQGKPDGLGAMQVNVPVAYTPSWGNIVASAYRGSHIGTWETEFGNGTGVFGVGFFGRPAVYISGMQVSEILNESKAVSGQISIFSEKPRTPALSIGKQDMLGKEPNGMSPYVVLTKSFQAGARPIYGTLGYGGGRFLDTFFYGVSAPLGKSFNLAAEYDGYQYNFGAGWRPGGQFGKLTIFAGHNSQVGYVAGMAVVGTFK